VSLDLFGPSLFVVASEREGGMDISVGYAADAVGDDEAAALAEGAVALLTLKTGENTGASGETAPQRTTDRQLN
jgi:hypothetical protein